MVNRMLKLPAHHSFFLFGARGTGKSYLLQYTYKKRKVLWIDLLNEDVFEQYLLHPQTLRHELEAKTNKEYPHWVVIDEIQRVPALLNVVHQILESRRAINFALTGSSARKLKQKGVNLLAGRVWVKNLYPFTTQEYPQNELKSLLQWGSLPSIIHCQSDEEKREYLKAYTLTYIKTEIQEEQWVRKLVPFRNFLPMAAQMNGQPLNFFSIAKQIGVDITTVQNYFEILEETLLGFYLKAYHRSIRKQQRMASKFYFFDLGIKRALERKLNLDIVPGTSDYGDAFEHMVILEVYRLNNYLSTDYELYYLQTKDNVEIDLILDRPGKPTALIEIKSKTKISEEDLRHIRRIQPDVCPSESFLLSNDPLPKKIGPTLCLPWKQGLMNIFDL